MAQAKLPKELYLDTNLKSCVPWLPVSVLCLFEHQFIFYLFSVLLCITRGLTPTGCFLQTCIVTSSWFSQWYRLEDGRSRVFLYLSLRPGQFLWQCLISSVAPAPANGVLWLSFTGVTLVPRLHKLCLLLQFNQPKGSSDFLLLLISGFTSFMQSLGCIKFSCCKSIKGVVFLVRPDLYTSFLHTHYPSPSYGHLQLKPFLQPGNKRLCLQ